MVWLKTSDDFPDDCARVRLSDAAYRTHHEGLSWTMRRETGGWIDRLDLRRFAETTDPAAAVQELCAVGFWRAVDDGWQIMHAMDDQPEPEVLAQRRAATKERVRRHRMKKAGLNPDGNAVTDTVTERDTRDGSGRVGTGSPLQTNPALDEKPGPIPSPRPEPAVDRATGELGPACRWCDDGECPQCRPDLFEMEH
jgi:hypothetical protein